MKHSGLLIIIALFLGIMGCKKEENAFSFFRPTNPNNIKNLHDGEYYSWAAADTALIRADYFLNVRGRITTYGNKILAYGHCWAKTSENPNPSIGHNNDTIYSGEIVAPGEIEFDSYLSDLLPDTEYSIRSFAILADSTGNPADTGYNPVVTVIKTLPAIDEWFIQEGNSKPQTARFDAISFNLGDTIFFGTGNFGQKQLAQDLQMYDPVNNSWDHFDNVPTTYLPVSGESGRAAFADGIGFGLVWQKKNAPQGEYTRSIFVGLADFEGSDLRDYKSNVLKILDLEEGSVWRTSTNLSTGVRSRAVVFTIGSYAYIGTGSNSAPLNTWVVFDPAADYEKEAAYAWQTLLANNPTTKRVGAIAFSINGKGYFGLGKDHNDDETGTFLKDFWEFTPNSDKPAEGSWAKKADFPGEARANAVAFVIGSQGYVGSGDNIDGNPDGGSYTGQLFSDFYRYDPFNDRWIKVRDYHERKPENVDANSYVKPVTRASGFSGQTFNVGYVGFGICPDSTNRAQKDMWRYQPWETGAK